MNKMKRIIAVLLSIVMIFSIGVVDSTNVKSVSADTAFTITTPTAGSLKAAGYIDINWTAATSNSKLTNYQVYINGKLAATTNNTTYEYYTTKVNYHTVFVKANFADGTYMSTADVRFGVSKKGLCVNSSMGRNVAPYELNASWYYNWGVEPYNYPGYSAVEYVPMQWGNDTYDNINNRMNGWASKGYKYTLAFNEPDLQGQGVTSVADAVKVWPAFMNHGIRVGSPASYLWPANSNWLKNFMPKISNNVDFVTIHCYPDNYQGAGMAQWFVTEVVDTAWNMYHKPIWITEFSTSGNVITEAGTRDFVKAVLPELDKRAYVERYSFFSFDRAKFEGGLWWHGSGALSTSGKAYRDFGNPTTDLIEGSVKNPGSTNSNGNGIKAGNKPAKGVIKSAKNIKKKKIKITLKKIKGAKGYQIRCCDNKKFNGYWQKNTKKVKYTIKGLDKNTRYYIKVRAYTLKGKEKVYGAWSKTKKVMVKK